MTLTVLGLHLLARGRQDTPIEPPDRIGHGGDADDTYTPPHTTLYNQLITYSSCPSQGSKFELNVGELRRERANRRLETFIEVHGPPRLRNGLPMWRRNAPGVCSFVETCAVGTIGLLACYPTSEFLNCFVPVSFVVRLVPKSQQLRGLPDDPINRCERLRDHLS